VVEGGSIFGAAEAVTGGSRRPALSRVFDQPTPEARIEETFWYAREPELRACWWTQQDLNL
jgi:hypothetical protein